MTIASICEGLGICLELRLKKFYKFTNLYVIILERVLKRRFAKSPGSGGKLNNTLVLSKDGGLNSKL